MSPPRKMWNNVKEGRTVTLKHSYYSSISTILISIYSSIYQSIFLSLSLSLSIYQSFYLYCVPFTFIHFHSSLVHLFIFLPHYTTPYPCKTSLLPLRILTKPGCIYIYFILFFPPICILPCWSIRYALRLDQIDGQSVSIFLLWTPI